MHNITLDKNLLWFLVFSFVLMGLGVGLSYFTDPKLVFNIFSFTMFFATVWYFVYVFLNKSTTIVLYVFGFFGILFSGYFLGAGWFHSFLWQENINSIPLFILVFSIFLAPIHILITSLKNNEVIINIIFFFAYFYCLLKFLLFLGVFLFDRINPPYHTLSIERQSFYWFRTFFWLASFGVVWQMDQKGKKGLVLSELSIVFLLFLYCFFLFFSLHLKINTGYFADHWVEFLSEHIEFFIVVFSIFFLYYLQTIKEQVAYANKMIVEKGSLFIIFSGLIFPLFDKIYRLFNFHFPIMDWIGYLFVFGLFGILVGSFWLFSYYKNVKFRHHSTTHQVRRLVTKAKMPEAFDKLLLLLADKDHELRDEVSLYYSQYSEYRNRQSEGLKVEEETLNRIMKSTLKVVSKVEKDSQFKTVSSLNQENSEKTHALETEMLDKKLALEQLKNRLPQVEAADRSVYLQEIKQIEKLVQELESKYVITPYVGDPPLFTDPKQKIQAIITEIDHADWAKVFELIDELRINTPEYNRLKKQFISGKTEVEFPDQVKVFVKNLSF